MASIKKKNIPSNDGKSIKKLNYTIEELIAMQDYLLKK